MKLYLLLFMFLSSCVRLDDFKKGGLNDLLVGRFVAAYKGSGTEATFQIQGTLKDSSGNPIANATLSLGVSQNLMSRAAVTTSTTTDANGNYALNLRIGNFTVRVTNSSGVEIGTFQIAATSNTEKPSITVTSGSIVVVVNSVGGAKPDIVRNWASYTDMKDGTIKVDVNAGIFGGQSYSTKTLFFEKCSHGQIYNSISNSCSGTALQVQYCTSDDTSCNGGISDNSLNSGPLYDVCNNLNSTVNILGNKKGWRVPSKNELRLLINCNNISELPGDWGSCASSPQPSINNLFPNTMPAIYWSSTITGLQPWNAWYVVFSNGSVNSNNKVYTNYVRCITDL